MQDANLVMHDKTDTSSFIPELWQLGEYHDVSAAATAVS